MIDERHGMLIVRAIAPSLPKGRRYLCDCDCGGTKDVFATDLRRGNVKSCGCLVGRSGPRFAAVMARRQWKARAA